MNEFRLPPRLLHPLPQRVQWGADVLRLADSVTVDVSAGLDQSAAALFAELWNKFTLGSLKITASAQPDATDWAFTIAADGQSGPRLPRLEGKETYRLDVTPAGVAARAKDQTSLTHAWMTFVQTLQIHSFDKGAAVCGAAHVSIADWPAMPFRGLHLCIFPETSMLLVKKVLRLSALLKITHVVLEFWGAIKLDAMKELAWPEAMTKAQALELVQLSRQLGVEVIPAFNILGHAAGCRCSFGKHVVLDQNPRLATLFEPDGWTWCLTNKDTIALHKEVIAELAAFAGDGRYFHIGCDEAYSIATCDNCRRHEPHELFARQVNEMTAFLESINRRPIIWGDFLLDRQAWQQAVAANSESNLQTHKALDNISRNVIIADWQYEVKSPPLLTLAHFRNHGFDVLGCPWLGFDNVQTVAAAARDANAMGVLLTTWNTLPKQIVQLFFSANALWTQDLSVLENPQFRSIQRTTASHYSRLLSPSRGVYQDAGWELFEADSRNRCGG